MKGNPRDQNGAVAVILAISIAMILGFTAIVVDIGYLFEVRRQLQSAADAAALAGCQELIKGRSNTEILAMAENYAKKNDFSADVGTSEVLFMHPNPPDTEVGANYVQVTVEKNMNLFFARIWNRLDAPVTAQAKAQVVYVTGAKDLVPWGLVVIHATAVTARIGNEPEQELSSSDGKLWHGNLTVPATPSQQGYPVTVTTYNGQGYPEAVVPAGRVIVRQSSDPITKVYFSPSYVIQNQDSSTTLYVESSAGAPTDVRFAGKRVTNWVNVSGNLYSASVSVPAATNSVEFFPVDVTVGSYTLLDAAVLVVRRSTYAIKNVNVYPSAFVGGSGPAGIDVELGDFIPGNLYDLKLVSGSESGNFAALDFSQILHPPDYTYDHGLGSPGGADYQAWLTGGFPNYIHIGDRLWSETGNVIGPTDHALDDRITCFHTYNEWINLAPGSYHSEAACPRLVQVPILEKIEDVTGKSQFQVVAIGAFYLNSYDKKAGNATGTFVNWVKAGGYDTEPPPGSLYNMTARLVPPNF